MASLMASRKQIGSSVRAAPHTCRPAPRVVLPPAQASSSNSSGCGVVSQVLAAGVAVSLLLGSVVGPATAALPPQKTLADVSRPAFQFIDSNNDGIVTQDEIAALAKSVSEENDFNEPRSNLLAFTIRLFDLNQDGKLTTDEVLTGLTLDTAVNEEGTTLREDVYKVFDRDNNGKIDLAEWKAPFGNLGQNGEELKEWTFSRVQYLADRDGNLNVGELANALTLMRLELLGY